MTDLYDGETLPATLEQRDAYVAAPADTDSWTEVVAEVAKLAQYIAPTEFVPRSYRDNPAAATAAILYGREVGLPPMTALNGVHMVEGSPSLSAENMRALVLAAGHDLEFTESTSARCVVRGRRRGSQTWQTVEWTIDQAKAAGLFNRRTSPWVTYPRRMLQARASSELCELVFPDVIHGFRALEAQQDAAEETPDETPATATTPVRRAAKRTPAAKRAAALNPPPAATLPAAGGVPLPGEAGYDAPRGSGSADTVPGSTAADSGHGSSSDGAGTATPGPDPSLSSASAESPTSGADPSGEGSGSQTPRPSPESPDADPVTGEIVDEPHRNAAPQDAEDPGDVQDAVIVEGPQSGDPRPSRPAQRRMILAKFGDLGFKDDRSGRLHAMGVIVGREVPSTTDLTMGEASTLLDVLALCASREQLSAVVEQTMEAERQGTEE